MIRVVIADGNPVVRAGRRALLDAQDDLAVVGPPVLLCVTVADRHSVVGSAMTRSSHSSRRRRSGPLSCRSSVVTARSATAAAR